MAAVTTVDLNADLAEGEDLTGSDRALLGIVTSASLACGFHAGNPRVMRTAAAACMEEGVVVGAHVSFRDREGFGRKQVPAEPAAVASDIAEQVSVLAAAIAPEGAAISYVKPHGALYNRMGVEPVLAAAVASAVARAGIGSIVAQAGSAMVRAAGDAGLDLVPEGFPDRGYLPDGRLVPREMPGALVLDPEEVARRALSLASRGGLDSVEGGWTAVEVATVCVHGDSPGAADTARAVRVALEAGGVQLRAFAAVPRGDGGGRAG